MAMSLWLLADSFAHITKPSVPHRNNSMSVNGSKNTSKSDKGKLLMFQMVIHIMYYSSMYLFMAVSQPWPFQNGHWPFRKGQITYLAVSIPYWFQAVSKPNCSELLKL